MPNIGSVLKSEITRLSRKAVKEQVGPLQSTVTAQRRQITALKRQVATLERQLVRLARGRARHEGQDEDADPAEGKSALRFQARGLKPLRDRLGLSAADFGRLVGVSAQSIYNWEAGKARPRRSQIAALAPLRAMGKREAIARLNELGGGDAE